MSQIFDIVSGHIRELVGSNDDLSESRMDICKECPIYIWHSDYGPMCDKKQWINKEDKTSYVALDGYTRGCGCRLKAKTRNPKNKCIIGKW